MRCHGRIPILSANCQRTRIDNLLTNNRQRRNKTSPRNRYGSAMNDSFRKTSNPFRAGWMRNLGVAGACLAVACFGHGQNTPLLSGGGAFFTSSGPNGTSYLPIAEPLIAVPLGDRLLIESRAALIESVTPNGSARGGYDHQFFAGLTYLQGDVIASPHLNLVLGSFLIPFGTYNERLSPVWINNLQDGPLIAGLGVMGTGTGLGAQLRGSAVSTSNYSLTYAAYYSARSGNQQFNSERAFGGQASVYFKPQRVEAGLSYGRLLQGTEENFYGMHVWYEPKETAFRLRSEFARGHHAQGYWIEADYRTAHFGGLDSWRGRFEPVLRFQQSWRRDNLVSDGLPLVNTQRLDVGMNYVLPHNMRIMTSYAHEFSSQDDSNLWETGLVYRFLTPAWKGRNN
jgi:hypothetical protein